MSELKATTVYDAYWKANSTGEGTGILVYLKSEADKYIKELKEQNHELCQALHSMYSEEEMNYQKYKRCLAMARWCGKTVDYLNSEGYIYEKENHTKELTDCIRGTEFYDKWYHRWLALAEKFKVAK